MRSSYLLQKKESCGVILLHDWAGSVSTSNFLHRLDRSALMLEVLYLVRVSQGFLKLSLEAGTVCWYGPADKSPVACLLLCRNKECPCPVKSKWSVGFVKCQPSSRCCVLCMFVHISTGNITMNRRHIQRCSAVVCFDWMCSHQLVFEGNIHLTDTR